MLCTPHPALVDLDAEPGALRHDDVAVFDDERLLAIGALIRSHLEVGNQLGARATAARSAFLWGSRPIKVSSDGDVTVYFKSRGGDQECAATMNFL